ncbi:hypothetical protein Tco_0488193 [Tanacetum coccineum]
MLQNQAQITIFCRQGSRSVAVLLDQQMESSESHEYPSFISSFNDTHTHDDVWAQEEARLQYEEMIKMRDLGADTPIGVPYTGKEIFTMVRKGKQRGHIPGVGRQVAEKGKTHIFGSQPRGTYIDSKIDDMLASRDKVLDAAKEEAKRQKRKINLLRRVVMSNDQKSQLLTQLGSQSEVDGARGGSRSGGGGDDQSGRDEDAGKDDDDGQ